MQVLDGPVREPIAKQCAPREQRQPGLRIVWEYFAERLVSGEADVVSGAELPGDALHHAGKNHIFLFFSTVVVVSSEIEQMVHEICGLDNSYFLAFHISRTKIYATALLSLFQVPLTRANLQDVSHLVETLKAIEYCFARKDQAVAEAHTLIVRGYCETIYGITYQVKLLVYILCLLFCLFDEFCSKFNFRQLSSYFPAFTCVLFASFSSFV